ncbi:MAG: hypothetical protein GX876_12300 [Bacteroidales bacterium]|nr:hypothetical protein [Bacteroidales bacterium]
METVGFYIFYGISRIITLLPLKILYLFSDLLFLLSYYFPGYRRKVVTTNLKNAFPGKNEKELAIIRRKFYRHFSDLVMETLKLININNKELAERMNYENLGLLDRLYAEGRDVVLVYSHYCNWEWTSTLCGFTGYKCIPVYRALNNKYFNRFMLKLRSRNEVTPVAMSAVIRKILTNRKDNVKAIYGLIADQTPPRAEIQYRTRFLNQDTPVYLGAEKIALKYDMAVIFMNIRKLRRGYYSCKMELLFEHTSGLEKYIVTNSHVRRLEEIIEQKPEYWLWSHRRWKY